MSERLDISFATNPKATTDGLRAIIKALEALRVKFREVFEEAKRGLAEVAAQAESTAKILNNIRIRGGTRPTGGSSGNSGGTGSGRPTPAGSASREEERARREAAARVRQAAREEERAKREAERRVREAAREEERFRREATAQARAAARAEAQAKREADKRLREAAREQAAAAREALRARRADDKAISDALKDIIRALKERARAEREETARLKRQANLNYLDRGRALNAGMFGRAGGASGLAGGGSPFAGPGSGLGYGAPRGGLGAAADAAAVRAAVAAANNPYGAPGAGRSPYAGGAFGPGAAPLPPGLGRGNNVINIPKDGFRGYTDSLKGLNGATDKFSKGLLHALGQLDSGLRGIFNNLRQTIFSVQGALAAIGTFRIGRQAIQEAADFESALAQVAIVAADTGVSTDHLRERLTALSEESSVPLVELTKALGLAIGSLPKDTARAEKGFELLNEAQRAARASGGDVETIIRGLSGVLNTYGRSGIEATQISDKLFAVFDQGVATIPELAQSLGQIVGIAAQANIPIDELLGELAVLTRAGATAGEAVTFLRQAIISIQRPPEIVKERLKKLNLEFGEAAIRSKGIIGVLEEVQAKGGETVLGQLFTDIQGFLAASTLLQSGLGVVRKDIEGIAGSFGATDRALNKVKGTFNESAAIVRNKFSRAMIEIGERAAPLVLKTLEEVTDFLLENKDSIANGFKSVLDALVAIGKFIATNGGNILAFFTTLLVSKGFAAVAKGLTLVSTALATLAVRSAAAAAAAGTGVGTKFAAAFLGSLGSLGSKVALIFRSAGFLGLLVAAVGLVGATIGAALGESMARSAERTSRAAIQANIREVADRAQIQAIQRGFDSPEDRASAAEKIARGQSIDLGGQGRNEDLVSIDEAVGFAVSQSAQSTEESADVRKRLDDVRVRLNNRILRLEEEIDRRDSNFALLEQRARETAEAVGGEAKVESLAAFLNPESGNTSLVARLAALTPERREALSARDALLANSQQTGTLRVQVEQAKADFARFDASVRAAFARRALEDAKSAAVQADLGREGGGGGNGLNDAAEIARLQRKLREEEIKRREEELRRRTELFAQETEAQKTALAQESSENIVATTERFVAARLRETRVQQPDGTLASQNERELDALRTVAQDEIARFESGADAAIRAVSDFRANVLEPLASAVSTTFGGPAISSREQLAQQRDSIAGDLRSRGDQLISSRREAQIFDLASAQTDLEFAKSESPLASRLAELELERTQQQRELLAERIKLIKDNLQLEVDAEAIARDEIMRKYANSAQVRLLAQQAYVAQALALEANATAEIAELNRKQAEDEKRAEIDVARTRAALAEERIDLEERFHARRKELAAEQSRPGPLKEREPSEEPFFFPSTAITDPSSLLAEIASSFTRRNTQELDPRTGLPIERPNTPFEEIASRAKSVGGSTVALAKGVQRFFESAFSPRSLERTKEVEGSLIEIVGALQEGILNGAAVFKEVFFLGADVLTDALTEVFATAVDALRSSVVDPVVSAIGGPLGGVFGALSTGIEALGDKTPVTAFESSIVDGVTVRTSKELIPTAGGRLLNARRGITEQVSGAQTALGELAEALPQVTSFFLKALTDAIPSLFDTAGKLIADLIVKLAPLVGPFLTTFINSLLDQVPVIVDALVEALPVLLDGLLAAAVSLLRRLPALLQTLLQGIVRVLPKLLKSITDALPDVLVGLTQAAVSFAVELLRAIPDIVDAFIQAVPDIIEGVIAALPGMIEAIIRALPAIIGGLIALFPRLVVSLGKALGTFLLDSFGNIGKVFSSAFFERMGEFFVELFEKLGEFANNLLGSIGSALSGGLLKKDSVGGNVVGGAAIGAGVGFVVSGGNPIGAAVGGAIGAGVGFVKSLFHQGGVVSGPSDRAGAALLAAAGAPRFALGGLIGDALPRDLMGDEIIGLLQRDEGVLRGNAMDKLGPSRFRRINAGESLESIVGSSGRTQVDLKLQGSGDRILDMLLSHVAVSVQTAGSPVARALVANRKRPLLTSFVRR